VSKPAPVLRRPPQKLNTLTLETEEISPESLFRVSRHSSGEPYFGVARINRFDDNNRVKKRRFGTCYFGFDVETAISETLLHDQSPVGGRFAMAEATFKAHQLLRFKGAKLTVAVMLGVPLKTIGGNGALSTIKPYALPWRWAAAIYKHPQTVDGLLYMSRHLNDRRAVVIFSRAKHKIVDPTYTALDVVPRIVNTIKQLHIHFPY
jgi:hypothetical protein